MFTWSECANGQRRDAPFHAVDCDSHPREIGLNLKGPGGGDGTGNRRHRRHLEVVAYRGSGCHNDLDFATLAPEPTWTTCVPAATAPKNGVRPSTVPSMTTSSPAGVVSIARVPDGTTAARRRTCHVTAAARLQQPQRLLPT